MYLPPGDSFCVETNETKLQICILYACCKLLLPSVLELTVSTAFVELLAETYYEWSATRVLSRNTTQRLTTPCTLEHRRLDSKNDARWTDKTHTSARAYIGEQGYEYANQYHMNAGSSSRGETDPWIGGGEDRSACRNDAGEPVEDRRRARRRLHRWWRRVREMQIQRRRTHRNAQTRNALVYCI